jgi:hypothetical protein
MVADDDGIVYHDLQGAGSRRSFSDGSGRAGGRWPVDFGGSGDGPWAMADQGIPVELQCPGGALRLFDLAVWMPVFMSLMEFSTWKCARRLSQAFNKGMFIP